MFKVGDTVEYRGRRWRLASRRSDVGPRFWWLVQRAPDLLSGIRGRLAHETEITVIEPFDVEVGQRVHVGASRRVATVVAADPELVVEYPEEIVTLKSGLRYRRDPTQARPSPTWLNF